MGHIGTGLKLSNAIDFYMLQSFKKYVKNTYFEPK